jgi:hypothetical protein
MIETKVCNKKALPNEIANIYKAFFDISSDITADINNIISGLKQECFYCN